MNKYLNVIIAILAIIMLFLYLSAISAKTSLLQNTNLIETNLFKKYFLLIDSNKSFIYEFREGMTLKNFTNTTENGKPIEDLEIINKNN